MPLIVASAARLLRPCCGHRRRLSSSSAVETALSAARLLDANEQAQLLDSLIGDLRGDLLETQQQPPADALALATRLADHGDLMRAALNSTISPSAAAAADRRRTLFASKTAVTLLPKRSFPGRLVVARNADEICAALEPLRGASVVGFDTETRPEFRAGHSQNPTALIQVADADYACLLQIRARGRWTCRENFRRERWLPEPLVELLEDDSIVKAGVGVAEDLRALNKEHSGLKATGACDLEQLVLQCTQSAATINLQAMVAIYLHFQLEKTKRIQCSNWEAESFNDRQTLYAATDAWVGFLLHEKINGLLPKQKKGGAKSKSKTKAKAKPAAKAAKDTSESIGEKFKVFDGARFETASCVCSVAAACVSRPVCTNSASGAALLACCCRRRRLSGRDEALSL